MRKSKSLATYAILSLFLVLAAGMAQAQDRVRIRWCVGLSAGADAPLV